MARKGHFGAKRFKRMRLPQKKNPPSVIHARRVVGKELLDIDDAEYTVGVVRGSGGVEELVGGAVRSGAAAELDPPELVDHDGLAFGIDYRPNQGAGRQVEAVNRAGVRVVADEQGVAERAEVCRGDGQSPGLVERLAVD